jgi:pimeloyl-ACP methyl ester carboxylesterase
MPKITHNDIEIAYQARGEGTALLFISGVGYGGWFWQRLVAWLEKNRTAKPLQTVTFDNRGAGESSKPPGPYSVTMLAKDTAALLDALGIQGACIFGHSLGGFIAQELAISRPDLVGRLILASTNHGGIHVVPITPEALQVLTDRSGDPQDLVRRGVAIAAAPGFSERQPDLVRQLIEYRLGNPVPPAQYSAQVMAGAAMAQLSEQQVIDRMSQLRMPVLVLFGEHDRVVPAGNATLLAAKIPLARVRILPGCGHIFPIEDPAATGRAILEFLDT